MTHLTMQQIVELADQGAPPAEGSAAWSHLRVCLQCRMELRLQERIAQRAVRSAEREIVVDLAARVMERIAPPTVRSWDQLLLNNLGNIIAMAIVLVIVGFAVISVDSTAMFGQTEPSILDSIVRDGYSRLNTAIHSFDSRLASDAMKVPSQTSMLLLASMIGAGIFIVGIDKLVFQRIFRN